MAVRELGWEDIGHGNELHGTVLHSERVLRGSGASASAPDQGQLDGVVLGRMNMRQRQAGQGGHPCDAAAVAEELAS